MPRTLAEAVALLEAADDPAALITSRGIVNRLAGGTEWRNEICPIAQFLSQETGLCAKVGSSIREVGMSISRGIQVPEKLLALLERYDQELRS